MPQKRIKKKVTKQVQRFIQDYLSLLKNDGIPVAHAFVFASHTKGTARQDSDIDVAIISKKLRNSPLSTAYLLHKAHELDVHRFYLEPHGFHPNEFVDENPIVCEIKKTGILIK